MKISVSSSDELKRLDSFLSKRLVQFSRTNIQKMITNGLILVNEEKVKKNFRLSYSDNIDIDLSSKVDKKKVYLEKWDYPLDIIYQDKDFAIINKPRGVIVHPAQGNHDKTLVNILLHRFDKELKNAIDPSRPGIVHRLDKDTTGIMIIALNEHAHWKISDQFKDRTIQKEYIALTWSQWKEESGVIENTLGRNKRNPIQFESSDIGKKALNSRNYTQCDSLLMGNKCGAHTVPSIKNKNSSSTIEHEATTSKINDDQLFYCNQRGLNQEQAVSLIVNGFCKEVLQQLPIEFAVEAQKLVEISLEGSVG